MIPKPELRNDGKTAILIGTNQVLTNIHDEDECKNEYCCIHNPSNHYMVTWPQVFIMSHRRMERLCVHNIGHVDPDEINENKEHYCDGCCNPAKATDRRAAILATKDKNDT